jgi:transcription-repair coupling factor (superfamily II helicase)
VVSRKTLKKNTFNISKGDKISLEFLEEILHEYRFERVEFV